MENKDAHLIRKYMNLMESIETKIIVEDESTDINEDLFASAAREGKLVAAELEGFLKTMKQDSKISAELTRAGIRDAEELLAALKGNKLSSTLKGSLELNVLKSQTTNAKLIDLASENLARNQKFLQKYSNEIKQGQPQFEAALKKAGYSDRAITKIVEKSYLKKPSGLQTVGSKEKEIANIKTGENQRVGINYDSKTGKWTITTQRLKDKLAATQKAKTVLADAKNKSIIEKLKELFKNGKDVISTGTIAGIKRVKISKKLLGLALALGGGYVLYSLLSPKGDGSDIELVDENNIPIPLTPQKGEWATCIQDLLNNKSGSLVTTESGQMYVYVKTTGDESYDTAGGLKFFMNGRVFTYDNSKKGSWTCESGKVQTIPESFINEASGEASAQEIQTAAKELDDQLSGDFFEGDSTDMQDALEVIKGLSGKTYKGKSAIETLKVAYKKLSGGDLVNDVKTKLKNLDFVGGEAKTDALALLSTSTPTPTKGGLSGISITWDTEGGSGNTGGGKGGSTGGGKSGGSKYHDCSDFPMKPGCKSPRIKELQYCLGMEEKFQTGNFGPKTSKSIESSITDGKVKSTTLEAFKTNGVTKELFDEVMKNCKGSKSETPTTGTTSGSTVTKSGETTTNTSVPPVSAEKTTSQKGETPDELYRRLVKNKYLFGRLRGRRVVYKGPDLSKEEKDKLIQYMDSTGYRLSRFNNDYKSGDKLVFKRNKAGTPETAPAPEEPKTVSV